MPAELSRVRDRDAVHELLDRFFHGVDARRADPAFLRSVFVEAATVEFASGEYDGFDGLSEAIRTMLAPWKATLHALSGHLITLTEDTAHVSAVLRATHVHRDDDPGAHLHVGARVGAEAGRTADGWRLRRLAIGAVWTEGDPPAEAP